MTQRQPVPESSNRIWRGMGRVLGKAREYLLLLHPNSWKEEELLTVKWANGRLTVIYARHDSPGSDDVFLETWDAKCSEPRETRRRQHSGNLQQELDNLERGT